MTLEARLKPTGPYSLLLTARGAGDATRSFRDGVFAAVVEVGDRLEHAQAWQSTDGVLTLRAQSDAGLEQLRFMLALDADHSEFLRRFRRDRMLRFAIPLLAGLRQLRLATVAHALLRAFCGQLIESKRARRIELRLIRATCPTDGALYAPPRPDAFCGFAPAALQRFDLSARKAATIVRVCRTLEQERLRQVSPRGAGQRLQRERGLGPWSVGVIGLEGLGCYDFGLVGDLGLIKLCTALLGRRAEPEDTAELLARYGEWQGLASVYLLAGFAQGLLPVRRGRKLQAA